MSIKITSVQSATYDANGGVLFTVSVGDVTGVVVPIFNRPKDKRNDDILRAWLADTNNSVAAYVAPPTPAPTPFDVTRREERREEFANTLDRMNPLWHNSLTSAQQAQLATWRTAWLNYPNSEANTRPSLPSAFGGELYEATAYSNPNSFTGVGNLTQSFYINQKSTTLAMGDRISFVASGNPSYVIMSLAENQQFVNALITIQPALPTGMTISPNTTIYKSI